MRAASSSAADAAHAALHASCLLPFCFSSDSWRVTSGAGVSSSTSSPMPRSMAQAGNRRDWPPAPRRLQSATEYLPAWPASRGHITEGVSSRCEREIPPSSRGRRMCRHFFWPAASSSARKHSPGSAQRQSNCSDNGFASHRAISTPRNRTDKTASSILAAASTHTEILRVCHGSLVNSCSAHRSLSSSRKRQ